MCVRLWSWLRRRLDRNHWRRSQSCGRRRNRCDPGRHRSGRRGHGACRGGKRFYRSNGLSGWRRGQCRFTGELCKPSGGRRRSCGRTGWGRWNYRSCWCRRARREGRIRLGFRGQNQSISLVAKRADDFGGNFDLTLIRATGEHCGINPAENFSQRQTNRGAIEFGTWNEKFRSGCSQFTERNAHSS